jgi:perosamine synthetase
LAENGLSLVYVHRPNVGADELARATAVFESGWFGMGGVTVEFEERIAAYLDAPHVVAVQSGTAALHLALAAVGVGPGDEVVVPSFTFAASVQAILMAGATPVFCEVDERTLGIDPEDAFARVTPATKAIVPVDYGGTACDYDTLMAGARERGLRVVADSAHAFGSSYRGRPLGTVADAACFSFDASKNITCGDGGVVVTADATIAQHVRSARNLGIADDSWTRRTNARPWEYEVSAAGWRYRMGNLNAAIGLAQLDRADEFRERKRAIVRRYDEALAGVPGVTLLERRIDETFPFLHVIRVHDGRRDELIAHLRERNVQAWVNFIPNHVQPAFAAYATPLPRTERLFDEVVTLPLHSGLRDDEVERVVDGVRSFLGSYAAL